MRVAGAPRRSKRDGKQERHAPFFRPAMRAQPFASELGKVVIGRARAQCDAARRDHGHVTFHLGRHFESCAGSFTRHRFRDAGNGGQLRDHCRRRRTVRRQMHAHEAAQRTVMAYERIGDRADHAAGIGAEPRVQQIGHEHHVGRAVGPRHVVHAVIGGRRHHAAEVAQRPEPRIDRAQEPARLLAFRRMTVLHIVRQRQIEQPRAAALHQPHPRIQHEQRQIGRILIGRSPSDQGAQIVDPMRRHPRPIGALGGGGDSAVADDKSLCQSLAQLVLGGDDGDRDAGLLHRGQDGRCPQLGIARHHDGRAGAPVEIEIARDAMHRGRGPGHDRAVVGIGESRHRRRRLAGKPFFRHPCDDGQFAARTPLIEIGRVAAIEADDHDRPLRPLIDAAVHHDLRTARPCRHRPIPALPSGEVRPSRVAVKPLRRRCGRPLQIIGLPPVTATVAPEM